METASLINSLFAHVSLFFLDANPQGLTLLVFLLIVLLLLAFTSSGAEAAIFSLSEKDVNMLKTKQHPAARRIINFLEEPREVYTSLLITGIFSKICIIVLSNFLLSELIPFQNWHPKLVVVTKVLLITFIVVFICEIFPKVWATQNNIRFAYSTAIIVEGIHLFLRRLSSWLVSVADRVSRRLGANKSEAVSIQELDEAIDIKTEEEASQKEKDIMKGIVKFGTISVKQIMRSRMEIHGLSYELTMPDLLKQIKEISHSRLPVYKSSMDDIAGMLNTKDLVPHINAPADFDWHALIRPPYFVPESKLIADLMRDFQTKHIHFAVVVDEFGGTSGIVTMEDIMEEVIGDIRDEFDEEEAAFTKIDNTNYIFPGRTMLHEVCKVMGLSMNTFDRVKGESESLGGLVLELAGEFPGINEMISQGDFDFTVLETDNRRIQQVKVTINIRKK